MSFPEYLGEGSENLQIVSFRTVIDKSVPNNKKLFRSKQFIRQFNEDGVVIAYFLRHNGGGGRPNDNLFTCMTDVGVNYLPNGRKEVVKCKASFTVYDDGNKVRFHKREHLGVCPFHATKLTAQINVWIYCERKLIEMAHWYVMDQNIRFGFIPPVLTESSISAHGFPILDNSSYEHHRSSAIKTALALYKKDYQLDWIKTFITNSHIYYGEEMYPGCECPLLSQPLPVRAENNLLGDLLQDIGFLEEVDSQNLEDVPANQDVIFESITVDDGSQANIAFGSIQLSSSEDISNAKIYNPDNLPVFFPLNCEGDLATLSGNEVDSFFSNLNSLY